MCLDALDKETAIAPFGCKKHFLHEECFKTALQSTDSHLVNVASLEAHIEEWNRLVLEKKVDSLQSFPLQLLPAAKAKNKNLLKCYECRAELTEEGENRVMAPHRENVGFLARKQALNTATPMERRQLSTLGVRFGTGTVSFEQLEEEEGGLWTRDEHEGLAAKTYRCGCPAEQAQDLTQDLAEAVRWQLHREQSLFWVRRWAGAGAAKTLLPAGWISRENPFLQCAQCGDREMLPEWTLLKQRYEDELFASVAEEQREIRVQHRFWQLLLAAAEAKGLDSLAERAREWVDKAEQFRTDIVHLPLEATPVGTFEDDGELMKEVRKWLEKGGEPTEEDAVDEDHALEESILAGALRNEAEERALEENILAGAFGNPNEEGGILTGIWEDDVSGEERNLARTLNFDDLADYEQTELISPEPRRAILGATILGGE